ncbi:hypothetical protein CHLRE_10g439750v5 [Chlamydomonas reinhardtii]|uniref:Uncharacterized protein n=1 Tax=Chlamydomonas reinhardtii TaxID=3055 RepID=A0A2K3DAE9_CHLRE|nr:uncharacterized protein CHLRE_10g439750v5 [Chlamydomonas reinhardtii]PNW77510.1 hypothetical protein CHLRE_10g439750v5 [Chlamydomonas reinhardtii]
MSRKRSELSDAILWRRERPGTCDLASSGRRRGVGTQGDVQGAGRPATALGWGEASSTGRSLGRPWTAEHIPAAPAFRNGSAGANRPPPSAQASHASLASRGSSLPPLPRGAVTTAWLAAPSTARSGAASAPLTTLSYVPGTDPAPAELLGDFQEALYQNCHPQQTTSRLLRLGAGTPGPGTGTGRFTRRAQSPNLAAGASSMGVGAPSGRGGSPVAGGGGGGGGGALSGGTNPAAHVRAHSTPNGQGIPLPGTGHVGGGGGGGGGGAATARAASPGLRTMSPPPLPPPPPLNPAALAAAFPGVPGGAMDTTGLNLDGGSGRTPEAVAAVSGRVQAAWSAMGPSPSSLAGPPQGRAGQGGAGGGWGAGVGVGAAGEVGGGGGRPGGAAPGHGTGRHGGGGGGGGGGREQGAMLEDARRLAAQAAEVLYGSETEVSASDRAAAALALQQLEALLGRKEVSAAALGQAARSLKTDVGRELHFSEKQMSFAAAQIKVLDRQQERLRQHYNPRLLQAPHPPPLPLPDPTAAATVQPDDLQGLAAAGGGGGSGRGDGSVEEGPESPTMRYGVMGGGGQQAVPGVGGMLDGGGSAGNWWGGGGGGGYGGQGMEPEASKAGGNAGGGGGGGSFVSFGIGGGGGGSGCSTDRWNLADAMERTLQLRALSRAEAALAGVAAARAEAERPRSSGAGEGPGGLDVEELRLLKHMPGAPGAGDQPLSYLGVNVRRAPTPLPGGEAAAAASFMRGAGAGAGGGGGGGGGSAAAWDPNSTLQWSNRGISTQKMPLLREVLSQSPRLVRLCLGGNKLCNEDVMELMLLLSEPSAPRVTELDLEQNTHLSWRCALPLALALGMSPDASTAVAADWAAVAAALPPGSAATPASVVLPSFVPSAREKIRRLPLQRLGLSGVKLGDKGAAALAEGLRANSSLLELDLQRCGLTDVGGSLLFEVLGSNITLQRLDCSWNTLRAESGRVLEVALAGNAGLRELGLAHNGLADVDGARVLKGLLSHGKWLRVDLTHNNLGPGACMMAAELFRRLGEAAAAAVRRGGYAEAWGPGGGGGAVAVSAGSPRRLQALASQRAASFLRRGGGGEGLLDGPERSSASLCASPTGRGGGGGGDGCHLGGQLAVGQPALLLDGNPLGNTGLRILLSGLDAMSRGVADAAGLAPPAHSSLDGSPPGLPPSPLALSIAHCNVAPPSDRSAGANAEEGAANPFLPSIAVLCRPEGAAGAGKDGKDGKKKAAAAAKPAKEGKDGKGKGKGDKGGGGDDGGRPPVAPLTLQSPHLDLQSPAGMYSLDLAHPGTSALVSYLLRLRQTLEAAVAAGAAHGVALSLVDITVNGRPVRTDALAGLVAGWSEGRLELTVRAPAQLAVEAPAPLSAAVVEWLAGLMADPAASPLWKLAVVQAAGACCYFTPGQCVALLSGFDPQSAEFVAAAQMLYARSVQPLAFWQQVLPRFTPPQEEALRAMVGDLRALDLGCPMGRYALNLSRQVDRFVALRLQLASALEASWLGCRYYINWLNASLNGQPLDTAGLMRIRDFALPGAGVLRLDYVSYRKPGPDAVPASRDELAELQAVLRGINISHIAAGLAVRRIADPPPPPPKQEPPRSAHASRRKQQAPAAPPKPKPRLSALQLLRTPLEAVALILAKPAPPPPPQPDANGVVAPPPPPPTSWVSACGFSPAHLFRRAGMVLPECSFSGYDVPPRASTDGERPYSAKAQSFGRRPTRDGSAAPERASAAAGGGGGGPEKAAAGGKGGKVARGDKARRKSGTGGGKEGGQADEGAAWQRARAEHHASLLLAVHQAKDLPLLACKLGAAHLAAAVAAILREPGGPRAAAALLAALPPLAAVKFLYDQADPSPCLLPPEVRKTLLGLMPLAPERLKCYEAAARAASEAALQRTRRVRTALNLWAAERYLSAEQLTAILGTLHYESDRITAMVVLWPRVVRGGWKRTYERLSPAEQRQVMMRLGHWHVYSCLADPHGIAFALDLGEPEQKDIARELVRAAVKETLRARQDARARGGGGAAGNIQTLLELRGNGNPVSIPEDEKLWTMAESNFRTLDFLYSPTFEQSLAQVTASTVKIQRFWQGVRARRQAGSLPPPSPSALTDVEGIETSAEPSASA